MIKRNRIEMGMVLAFCVLIILFCHSFRMVEMPYETWFDQMPLAEKFYSQTLTLWDLMTTYGEHGMLGTNLLFLFNVSWFNLTTNFDVCLYIFAILIVGIVYMTNIRSSFSTRSNQAAYYVCEFSMCFLVFSVMNGIGGGMNTQVRLGFLFGIVSMHMCNKVMTGEMPRKYQICTYIIIFLSVNVFGTLYSCGAVSGIALVVLYRLFKKKAKKSDIKILVLYTVCFVLYFLQYGLLNRANSSTAVLSGGLFKLSSLLDMPCGLLAFCGNMVLGYSAVADGLVSDRTYMIIGALVLIIILYAAILYFHKKMYDVTFLPLLLMGYSFSVFVMVSVGRHSGMWLSNPWYHLHTVPALVAAVWIIAWSIAKCPAVRAKIKWTAIFFILLCSMLGTVIGVKRAPYEKEWDLSKQPYFFAESIDELPVDDNGYTPLLHSPEVTMQSIETMKKYNLSIYRYWNSYEKMCEERGDVEKIEKVEGVYDDGWMGKEAIYKVYTKDRDLIILDGYYNEEITGNEEIEIKIDEETVLRYVISDSSFQIEIPVKKNTVSTMRILAPFAKQADPPDIRILGFIIQNIAYSNNVTVN